MKYDMDTPIKAFDGEELRDENGVISLGKACILVLFGNLDTDRNMGASEKLDIYDLALRCKRGGVIEFSNVDFALIKERAAKALTIPIMGALVAHFEENQIGE
jgi:hypothetical protein